MLRLFRRLETGDFRLRADEGQWKALREAITTASREQARATLVAALVLGGVPALGQGPMVGGVPVVSAVLFLLALLLGWKLLK